MTAHAATIDSDRTTTRLEHANSIVRRNVLYVMGIGLVPIPFVDLVGVTVVQLKMLKQLSDHYEVSFHEHRVKNILASLIAGTGSVGFAAVTRSLIKGVPLVGQALGAVTVSLTAGALTHAVGRVFVLHFEAGGTILDFDPKKMRSYFTEEYERAKVSLKDVLKK